MTGHSQYGGRGFKSDELRQTNDIHFQKADDKQNAIKGLKQQVVGGFYCIKFQKTDFCITADASKNIFFKIHSYARVTRHRFKKINPKIFGKFKKNFKFC